MSNGTLLIGNKFVGQLLEELFVYCSRSVTVKP